MLSIFKNYISSKKLTAISTDDTIFKAIQSLYSKYYNNSGIKLVRCNSFLRDISDIDDQEKLIRDYHLNSNHRGITETLDHLKRHSYFPAKKNRISRVINGCEICHKLKYEAK